MPGTYRVEALRSAQRALERLPQDAQRRVRDHIRGLVADPRPPGTRALQGARREYRIRVGDYRIIYRVLDEDRLVRIVWIGHRRDAYRG